MTDVAVTDGAGDDLNNRRRQRRHLWKIPLMLVGFPVLFYFGAGYGSGYYGPRPEGGNEGIWWGLATAVFCSVAVLWWYFIDRQRLRHDTLTWGSIRRHRVHLPEVTVASVRHVKKRNSAILQLVLDEKHKLDIAWFINNGNSDDLDGIEASGLLRVADSLEKSSSKWTKDAVEFIRQYAANPTHDAWPEPFREHGRIATWFKHDWE